MGKKRHQWRQQTWKTPGVKLHQSLGDYDDADGFVLHPYDTRRLTRTPAWSAHVDLPGGIANVQAVTRDRANDRVVVIGADDAASPTKIVAAYFDSAWSASSVSDLITGGPTALGGAYLQNVAGYGGHLYVITGCGDVYRGASYTSALSPFYTGSDAQILVALEDRLYMITTTGAVYRLNDADSAFEAYYTPTVDLAILYAAPFTQYLALLGRRTDGNLDLYRLYPSYTPSLDHLLPIPATGDFPAYARPWTVHHGALLLSTGEHEDPHSTTCPLFQFNGQTLALIDNVPQTIGAVERWTVGGSAVGGPAYIGAATPIETLTLLTWRTYPILASVAGASVQLQAQTGAGFVTLPGPTVPTPPSAFLPIFTVAGDDMLLLGVDSSDNEGLYHAGGDAYHSPATVTTARLDFGAPGRKKRINRLTALFSDHHSDVTVTLEYRIDDTTPWTEAASVSGTRRVSVDLDDVQAYVLQVRVTLTDTGNHAIDLLDLEVDYSR